MKKHTILLLAANPVGIDRLALGEEARAIRDELKRSRFRSRFQLVTREGESIDLLRELRELEPTVVHFGGHGGTWEGIEEPAVDASRRAVVGEPEMHGVDVHHGLFFQGPDGYAQFVSAAALKKTFGAVAGSVKLVVLSACYSEVQAKALLEHVDCVVGMRGLVRDVAAKEFAIGFYGGIGACQSIAAAWQQGKAAIALAGLPEDEGPQLRARNGVNPADLVLAASSERRRSRSREGKSLEPSRFHAAAPELAAYHELLNAFSVATPEVKRYIIDESTLIQRVTERFVGRDSVFTTIDLFFKTARSGYVIIEGDPGIGKTALAANLVSRRGYLHHFNVRAEGIAATHRFIENVSAQLIARYGLSPSVMSDKTASDGALLKALLQRASEKVTLDQPLVVVIDALEEVSSDHAMESANILYLPVHLPDHTFFILTKRRQDLQLRVMTEVEGIVLDHASACNIADVEEYIRRRCREAALLRYLRNHHMSENDLVNELKDKSEGNFMYLHHVLPEMERGEYSRVEIDAIPRGLQMYYEDHWRRMKSGNSNAWFTHKLPVLVALSVLPEAASAELISSLAGISLRDVRLFLNEWQPFLHADASNAPRKASRRFRIYHDSFREFIAQKEQVADERVHRKQMREKVAGSLWDFWLSDSSR